jgi:hypothetical protein
MNKREIIKKKLNKIKEKFNSKDRSEKEKKRYKESMISFNKHFHKGNYDEVDKTLDKLENDVLIRQSIPWSDSFDNENVWTNDSTYPWKYGLAESLENPPPTAQEGSGVIYFDDYSYSTGSTGTIMSPEIDLSSGIAPILSFYHYDATATSNEDTIQVVDGNDTVIFTTPSTADEWTKHTVELSTYVGESSFQFGFKGTSVYGYSNPHIDNVYIGEPQTCPEPTGLNVQNITTISADLHWTAGGSNETDWNIEYGYQGFTEGTGTISTLTTDSTLLTGLTSNTSYDFYVQANCGDGDTSPFAGPFTFTTSPTCDDTVTYTQVNNGDYTVTVTSLAGEAASVTVNGELESGFDYLYVTDGTEKSLNPDQNAGVFTNAVFTSTDGTISVNITNDGSITNGDITLAFACATCPKPTDLTASNITSTSADISWTAGGSETVWNIEYGDQGFTEGTGTISALTTDSTLLTGLTSNTSYDFYVQANCGDGYTSTFTGPFTFNTQFIPPYLNDFSTFPGTGWSGGQGLFAEGGPGPSGTTSNWYVDGFGNVGTTGAARINIYGLQNEWLISPVFDLSLSGDNCYLDMKAALTDWTNVSSDTMDDDDVVRVLISIDSQVSWTELHTWDHNNQPSATGTHMPRINLAAYNGGQATFAIYAESTTNTSDYDFFIDNFRISTLIPCLEPTGLNVQNITATSADLNWTAGEVETQWNIEYGDTGFTPGTGTTISVTTNPYSLTELTSSTSYDFYVQADCGDTSTWTGPFTFRTLGECNYSISVFDSFGDGWNGNSIKLFANGVLIDSFENTNGAGAEQSFEFGVNTGDSITSEWTSGSFIDETSYTIYDNLGNVVVSVINSSVPSVPIAFTASCALPTCPEPTELNVQNITTTSADLNWTAGGVETEWNIEYGDTEFTPGTGTTISVTTNPYSLTELTSSTSYDFYVQADCTGTGTGTGTGYWAGPFTFTTCDMSLSTGWNNVSVGVQEASISSPDIIVIYEYTTGEYNEVGDTNGQYLLKGKKGYWIRAESNIIIYYQS